MPRPVPPQITPLLLPPLALAEAAPSAPGNISPCLHHTAFLNFHGNKTDTVTLGYFQSYLAAEGGLMHSKSQNCMYPANCLIHEWQ